MKKFILIIYYNAKVKIRDQKTTDYARKNVCYFGRKMNNNKKFIKRTIDKMIKGE